MKIKTDYLGNPIFYTDFEINAFSFKLRLMKDVGLVPSKGFIDRTRKGIINHILAAPPTGQKEKEFVFWSVFQPHDLERRRRFRADFYKSLEGIQELWQKPHPDWTGREQRAPLFKSHKLIDQLTQFNQGSLENDFESTIFRIPIPKSVDSDEYKKFREAAINEFWGIYEKLPKAQKRKRGSYREFELKQREKNSKLFLFLCLECSYFRIAIDRYLIRSIYRFIRTRIRTREERRAWLLAFWPRKVFAYRIPLFHPILTSFFLSDNDITKLVMRTIVFDQQSDADGNSLRQILFNAWKGFLNIYPIYEYFMEKEIEEWKRTPRGKRIKFTAPQKELEASFEIFNITWKTYNEIAARGERCPIAYPAMPGFKGKAGEDRFPETLPFPTEEFQEEIRVLLKETAALTDVEFDRFIKLEIEGISVSEIARQETVSRQAIISSRNALKRKISAAIAGGKLTAVDFVKSIKLTDPNRYSSKADAKTLYTSGEGGIEETARWSPSPIDYLIMEQFFYK